MGIHMYKNDDLKWMHNVIMIGYKYSLKTDY